MHPLKDKITRFTVNIFIIACCTSWLAMMAIPSPMQAAFLGLISPPVDQLGLVMRFNMFAPDAPKYNHLVHADITFADGTHKQHKFNVLADYKDNFFLQQSKSHISALNSWLWHENAYPELKTATARKLALQYRNINNPPRTIELYDIIYPINLPSARASESQRKLLLLYTVQEDEQ